MPVTASEAGSRLRALEGLHVIASVTPRREPAVRADLDQHRRDLQQRVGARIESAGLDVDHDRQEAAEAARHQQRCGCAQASLVTRSGVEPPAQRFARSQRHQLVRRRRVGCPAPATLCASSVIVARVARQPVEIRAELAGECLQSLQRAGCFERLRVQLDGRMRGEDAGAAAGRFLGVPRVRRAVGAEEEARIAARRGVEQRLAVVLRVLSTGRQ